MRQKAQRLAHGGRTAGAQRLLALTLGVHVERLAQHAAHLRFVKRLFQNLQHPPLVDRRHGNVFFGIGRGQQSHDVPVLALGGAQQLQAVFHRHAVVGDQHGDSWRALTQQLQGFVRATGSDDGKLVREQARKPFAGMRLVIDKQDRVRLTRRLSRWTRLTRLR